MHRPPLPLLEVDDGCGALAIGGENLTGDARQPGPKNEQQQGQRFFHRYRCLNPNGGSLVGQAKPVRFFLTAPLLQGYNWR